MAKGYLYDDRYRTKEETRYIDSLNWTTKWAYDSMNRPISIAYPSGEIINLAYNSQGELETLGSVLQSVDYNERGQITKETLGNNKAIEYSYDPNNLLLSRIYSPAVMDLSYSYDAVGSIVTLTDALGGGTTRFTYDDLDRLLSGAGDLFNLSYTYNSIGNLLSVSSLGDTTQYAYGAGAGPHAVTSITNNP